MNEAETKELIRAIPATAWRRTPRHQYVYRDGKEIAIHPLFDGSKVFVAVRYKSGQDEWFTCDRSEVLHPSNRG